MKTNNIISITAVCAMLFSSCSNDNLVKNTATKLSTLPKAKIDSINVSGNYVSPDYAERAKGYDWIAAMVSIKDENNIDIKVRSRPDRKRPTCTLDAVARELHPGLYRAELKYGNILFMFSGNTMTIAPEDPKNETAVHFYCSGGGSIKGTYARINESVDTGAVKTPSDK